MDTYFVEKMSGGYVTRKGCWTMKEGRREAHRRTCTMKACDQSCGCLDQERTVHPFDGSGYTRVHHSSDGWIEMKDVPTYDATILHHNRKDGGGYWGYSASTVTSWDDRVATGRRRAWKPAD